MRQVDGVFTIEYATNYLLVREARRRRTAAPIKGFEKFGFHRALRLAGAVPGDRVRVDDVEFDLWPYPEPIIPGTDGMLDYPYIEVPCFRGTSEDEMRSHARDLAPRVITALLR